MAWLSGGSTNAALINNLAKNGLITSERVKNAMLAVDRAHFSPLAPYTDSPQPIGHSATISAPHMHASAAESLLPFIHPTARILDIGSGSGYLTFVLAHLVDDDDSDSSNEADGSKIGDGARAGGGKVIGVEHIPALADMGRRNVNKSTTGQKWLKNGKIQFVLGDGRRGWTDEARQRDDDHNTTTTTAAGPTEGAENQEEEQWDVIHVGAAAKEVHEPLIKQLKRPGRLFIPVEGTGGNQYIWVIDKDAQGKVTRRRDIGVRYVPLCDAPK